MKIVTLVKQVPDTTEVRMDPKTGTLIREGVPSIVNPYDKHALEEALRLRERFGGEVTVISMGPPQAIRALQECRALGADRCYLLSDRKFAGADTLATAYSLGRAVEKVVPDFDIILCGQQAIDGDTGHVGPQLGEYLSIPHVAYVSALTVEGRRAVALREMEGGHMEVEVTLPALFTVTKKINSPRYPTVMRILKAVEEDYPVLTADYIGVEEGRIGLGGSPTRVRKIFAPEVRPRGKILQGSTDEQLDALIDVFKKLNLV